MNHEKLSLMYLRCYNACEHNQVPVFDTVKQRYTARDLDYKKVKEFGDMSEAEIIFWLNKKAKVNKNG